MVDVFEGEIWVAEESVEAFEGYLRHLQEIERL